METITITIPKKILSGRNGLRRLVVVDPKEFEKELRKRWEVEGAKKMSKVARQAWEEKDAMEAVRVMEREKKQGKLRVLASLKELMKA